MQQSRHWHGEILNIFALEWCEELEWRVDESGNLVFSVDCSGAFDEGHDAQDIGQSDLSALRQAKADLPKGDWSNLWVARRRRQIPAGIITSEFIGQDERSLFEQAASTPPVTSGTASVSASQSQSQAILEDWHESLLKLFSLRCSNLWWRNDHGQMTFTVDCSDTFDYASADSETVHEADLPALQQASADLSTGYWPRLWIARKRRRCPMILWLERRLTDPYERLLFEQVVDERKSDV